jgi:hypothetical protein
LEAEGVQPAGDTCGKYLTSITDLSTPEKIFFKENFSSVDKSTLLKETKNNCQSKPGITMTKQWEIRNKEKRESAF